MSISSTPALQTTVIDDDLLRAVRAQLSLELDPSVTNPFSSDPARDRLITDAIERALQNFAAGSVDAALVKDLFDELVGLGPLQPLMADPETTDILVNSFDEVFIERHGKLERTAARFRDQAHLEQIIQKIVALVGREISLEKPVVDARMVDGSRANAVYAPVGGPTLCIRKFNRLRLSLLRDNSANSPSWVDAGGMSEAMAHYLHTIARARGTVLIAGATGSGKSTLLRSLVDAIPEDERVITIEDTAELDLDNPHWVRLECVHHHELGGQDTSSRRLDVADLVQNALRMRPDRLIIGEIRNSREAYHTLEALNTGHEGSATTVHASSAADALARLELLLGRSFGHLTPKEIRGYIARVFDVIVFISRLRTGRRCVLEIKELNGIDAEGEYLLQTVSETEIKPGSDDLDPVFEFNGDYRMSERMRRKCSLEGLKWGS